MEVTGQLNDAKCMTLQTAHESFGHAAPERILKMTKCGKYNFTLIKKSSSRNFEVSLNSGIDLNSLSHHWPTCI